MNFFKKIWPTLKDKYVIVLLIFILWISVFDRNNLIDRYKKIRELRQLEKDKIFYKEWIENDKKRMDELQPDAENQESNETLEKFAREQYYMKKDNEEIFVIVEE